MGNWMGNNGDRVQPNSTLRITATAELRVGLYARRRHLNSHLGQL